MVTLPAVIIATPVAVLMRIPVPVPVPIPVPLSVPAPFPVPVPTSVPTPVPAPAPMPKPVPVPASRHACARTYAFAQTCAHAYVLASSKSARDQPKISPRWQQDSGWSSGSAARGSGRLCRRRKAETAREDRSPARRGSGAHRKLRRRRPPPRDSEIAISR